MTGKEPRNDQPAGRMTGGAALAEMLRLADVGPMFGMDGFQLLPFYDTVSRLRLHHHLINDERSGAFAADAYARVTNRPGVCDGNLGPGATNLVTGLAAPMSSTSIRPSCPYPRGAPVRHARTLTARPALSPPPGVR